jgi:hypothetical protein
MYRSIETSIWSDPKVRALSTDGKLLFVYLITNNHAHLGGLYYLPKPYITHEISLSASRIDTLLDTLSSTDLVHYDTTTETVWVVNMFRYQCDGPKQRQSVTNHLKTLHNSCLVQQFCDWYGMDNPCPAHTVSHTPSNTVSDTKPPLGSAEQEQEKEQEKNRNRVCAASAALARSQSLPGFDLFWSAWPRHPRKVDKGRCKRLWVREGLEPLSSEIVSAIGRCKSSSDWTKDNGQFIPMPYTWLNQRRWEAPSAPSPQRDEELNFDFEEPTPEQIALVKGELP